MDLIPFLKSLPQMPDGDSDYVNAPDYYPWLNALARSLRATRVLEVGVYNGYSGVSFIYGNKVEQYVGIDNESFIPGSLNKAAANLGFLKAGQEFDFTLFHDDTQSLTELAFLGDHSFNFIHIDGEHSHKGAMRDMNTFWDYLDIGGHMLVDDSTFIPEVGRACVDFAQFVDEPHYNVKTFRGTWVFLKTRL